MITVGGASSSSSSKGNPKLNFGASYTSNNMRNTSKANNNDFGRGSAKKPTTNYLSASSGFNSRPSTAPEN